MNFDLNEEQVLLRDLITRFASDRYDSVRRLNYLREPNGFCRKNWSVLADAGALAFAFPEQYGGFGGGSVALITVMEALGRWVALEPLLPVIVLAGGVLRLAGSERQQQGLFPALGAGEQFLALAHFEKQARFNDQNIVTKALAAADGGGGGVRLSGKKHMVLGGPYADRLIVSARDAAGDLRLYVVAADAAGVAKEDYRLADGSAASDVTLTNVEADIMPGGAAELELALTETRLASAAELVGLMSMIFDATLDYIKTRNQFGQSLGQFQAIQHRMADHYSRLELSRSQLIRAAAQPDGSPERNAAVTGAKAFISTHAVQLAEDAIQLHGGIGTTEELMVGQAFKRVLVVSELFGDVDWELRRYNALVQDSAG